MGTIITHGKSQWGRANKHKRKDPEFDEELENHKDVAVTKPVENAEIIKEMTDSTEIGDTTVKKLYDKSNEIKQVLRNNRSKQPSTANVIEHNKYGNPVMKNKQEKPPVSPEEPPERTSTHLNHKKVVKANPKKTKVAPKKSVIKKEKTADKNDIPIDNKGVSFIEDIDDWEEKLKLLNGDIENTTPEEPIVEEKPKPKRKYTKRKSKRKAE